MPPKSCKPVIVPRGTVVLEAPECKKCKSLKAQLKEARRDQHDLHCELKELETEYKDALEELRRPPPLHAATAHREAMYPTYTPTYPTYYRAPSPPPPPPKDIHDVAWCGYIRD